jgi:hypothetical protein
MTKLELAYCAGVIDSDGCITIKSRKVQAKQQDAFAGRSYSASVFVRQVERGAVDLLLSLFGGTIRVHAPSTPGGRDLNHWEISHGKAVAAAKTLIPFLRIKHKQAVILQEFAVLMANHDARRHPYWFVWEDGEPCYSLREAAEVKNLNVFSLYQMVSNKTIPVRNEGRRVFVAKRFWDAYKVGRKGRSPLPPEYIAARLELCNRIRRLNGPTRGVTAADRTAS